VLAEIASDRSVGIEIDQSKIPVRDDVRGACELLGLDVLYVANEGKMVIFVDRERAGEVLAAIRQDPNGGNAARIGEVVAEHPGLAVLRTAAGGHRIIDLPPGELLPRIC
jgi:hydrogenase expression/formation protein HypE